IGSNYGVTNSGGLEVYAFQQTGRVYKAGYVIGTNNIVNGAWHLYEARRVSGTMSLWIDNVMQGSASLPSSISGNINWTIGNAGDYPSGPMGYMAEQVVYNADLSAANLNQVVLRLTDDYNLAIIPEPTVLSLVCLPLLVILSRRRIS